MPKSKKKKSPATSKKGGGAFSRGKNEKAIPNKILASSTGKPLKQIQRTKRSVHNKKGSAKKTKATKTDSRKRGSNKALPIRAKETARKAKGVKPTGKKNAQTSHPTRNPRKTKTDSVVHSKRKIRTAKSVPQRKRIKKKKPSLRVVKEYGKPQGISGPKGRKPPKVSKLSLEKARKSLERAEAKAKRDLAKLRSKLRDNERARALAQSKRGDIIEQLRASKEWLDVLSTRGKQLGHKSRIAQSVNQDGTSDMQLTVYDWPQEGMYQALTDFISDLTEDMPHLGKGIKLRVQTRISADRIESEKGKKRYAYLPSVLGHKAVYFNYVRPASFGTLLFNMRDTITTKLTEDGWRLVAISIDVRFDPRYMIEKGKK